MFTSLTLQHCVDTHTHATYTCLKYEAYAVACNETENAMLCRGNTYLLWGCYAIFIDLTKAPSDAALAAHARQNAKEHSCG